MRTRIISLAIIASTMLFACKNSGTKEVVPTPETIAQKVDTTLAFNPDSLAEEPMFDITTTEGVIRVKLYKETPLHKANFIKLASTRFYNDILFHRVIKGFMIQVGDPNTKTANADPKTFGTGGPGYTVPAEIIPEFKHKKGALSAARKPDTSNPNRESSGSQFFIVENPSACASLDGDYSVFGETISGIEVIDKIAAIPTGVKDLPTTPIKIISILPVTN